VDEIVMRVVDVLLAFPGILLNLAIVALAPTAGVGVFVFALAVNGWVGYARVARGQVLQLREREFVQAARAIGAPSGRIMLRHVAPNILSPLIVQASFGLSGVILVEAALSFLGFGIKPPTPSLGVLVSGGQTNPQQWWLTIFPGLTIVLIVLCINFVGDGLRDALDPTQKRVRA
jgi:ABC-type dipeptide/oligopeptide/nickel transport system permease subunit